MNDPLARYATPALRIGIALVLAWFGVSQLTDPLLWTGYLPTWLPSFGLSPETHVLLNGGAEVALAALLLAGLFTRVVAALSALHLLAIVFAVGYNAIGVRDFGLFIAAASVFLAGPDAWTIDARRTRRRAAATARL